MALFPALLHARGQSQQVNLVVNMQAGDVGRQLVENFLVVCIHTFAGIQQNQNRIGFLQSIPGAGDAHLLDYIARLAQAGRVYDMQWYAADLDGLANGIAGGAGNFADQRHLLPA